MKKQLIALALVVAASFALPLVTPAAPGGGGGHPGGGGGGGGRPGGGGARPAPASASRQQAPRPQAQRPAGFNFNHDVGRPGAAQQRPGVQRPGDQRPGVGARASGQRYYAPSGARSGGEYYGRFHGSPVRNPHGPDRPWGWNHGVPWYSSGLYWGGGFWGPFGLADLSAYALYGSIEDAQDEQFYQSYQAGPDSPGADLLQDYGLQQTQCGPANLVNIWGPGTSVICALPNGTIGPGNYQVDPSTFQLIPASN